MSRKLQWRGPHDNPGPPVDFVGSEDEQLQADIDGRTMASPALMPQRYVRPIPAESDEGNRTGGVNLYAHNNIDRGTEAHGADIDSKVQPKDISPHGDRHFGVTDDQLLVMPEDSNKAEEEYPVPVRIVNADPVEDVEILIERFNISAGFGPVKILSKDRKRIKAHLATISISGTVSPLIIPSQGANFQTAGFPLEIFSNGAIEITSTNELWIVMGNSTDSFQMAVYQERRRNADPHRHD